jgi:hypothetical protein
MPQLTYGDARRGEFVAKRLVLKRFVLIASTDFAS